MKLYYIILFSLCAFTSQLKAQELDAKVAINSAKIQSVDNQAIKELEESIRQILNEQIWSNAKFEKDEKVDCTVGITLNSTPSENSYGAEIHITSRRPVYNAVYVTPLINYRDTRFDFNYVLGQSLYYNELTISDNIIGVLAFYANIIIGLDFDSFSLEGGKQYFAQALEIANKAQSLGTKGWEPFQGKSRYDLALALTEESSKSFHSLWYNYHRIGLDEMAGNAARGRLRIIATLTDLEALQSARPSSLLLTLFSETKLEEFVKVCSEATAEEKKDVKTRLKKLFPAKKSLIDTIK